MSERSAEFDQGGGCVPCRVCGGDQTRGWHLHDRVPAAENGEVTKRPHEGVTAFSVRRIQYDAWAEGATKASPHGGAYLRSLLMENPYSDLNFPPGATTGGDQ